MPKIINVWAFCEFNKYYSIFFPALINSYCLKSLIQETFIQMSINKRIAELIVQLGDTENSFSKRLGASSSAIFNIVNPKGRMSYPSGIVLEKILLINEPAGRVSAEWLMRGEGQIFSDADEKFKDPSFLRNTITSLEDRLKKLESKL